MSRSSAHGSSPHATRAAIRQRSARRSMNSGLGAPDSVSWNAAAAASSSGQRVALCAPLTQDHADHPSTIHRPSAAAIGRETRKPFSRTDRVNSASHLASGSSSTGLSTMSPERHVRPRPPASAEGSSAAPNAARTVGDGGIGTAPLPTSASASTARGRRSPPGSAREQDRAASCPDSLARCTPPDRGSTRGCTPRRSSLACAARRRSRCA